MVTRKFLEAGESQPTPKTQIPNLGPRIGPEYPKMFQNRLAYDSRQMEQLSSPKTYTSTHTDLLDVITGHFSREFFHEWTTKLWTKSKFVNYILREKQNKPASTWKFVLCCVATCMSEGWCEWIYNGEEKVTRNKNEGKEKWAELLTRIEKE